MDEELESSDWAEYEDYLLEEELEGLGDDDE